MTFTVTTSQFNGAPLGCTRTRDAYHRCADKYGAAVQYFHVNMEQNFEEWLQHLFTRILIWTICFPQVTQSPSASLLHLAGILIYITAHSQSMILCMDRGTDWKRMEQWIVEAQTCGEMCNYQLNGLGKHPHTKTRCESTPFFSKPGSICDGSQFATRTICSHNWSPQTITHPRECAWCCSKFYFAYTFDMFTVNIII